MDLTRISRYISLLLRHQPEAGRLTVDIHGWCETKELVRAVCEKFGGDFDMATLEKIVAEDEKQRYSFSRDKSKIRANQGHSINVQVELEKLAPPEVLYHGTSSKALDAIFKEGLKPMSRLYVHLSADRDTAVKVGKRHGNPVVLRVSAGEMAGEGFEFFRSANGVWLVKAVPPKYLAIV